MCNEGEEREWNTKSTRGRRRRKDDLPNPGLMPPTVDTGMFEQLEPSGEMVFAASIKQCLGVGYGGC